MALRDAGSAHGPPARHVLEPCCPAPSSMSVTCTAVRLAALPRTQQQLRLHPSPAAMRWRDPAARLRWRQAAGRGGGPGRDSDSEEEDFFNSRSSISEKFLSSDDMEYESRPGDGDSEMRLYLDSADVAQWEAWAEAGIFYGITTNPTILKRDGVDCTIKSVRALAQKAFALDMEELQLQAWGPTADDMYACGMDIMDIDSRIVVKLPITLEGAKAAARLMSDGAPVTMTGVYASHQVVTALAMGALYAAPYVGRMTDAGKNGVEEAIKMQSIVDQSSEEGGLRLLVASLRSADELAELAAGGCNTFTISPAVAAQLFGEELTELAAATFEQHAAEMGAGGRKQT